MLAREGRGHGERDGGAFFPVLFMSPGVVSRIFEREVTHFNGLCMVVAILPGQGVGMGR
jgi:hypothetical protein